MLSLNMKLIVSAGKRLSNLGHILTLYTFHLSFTTQYSDIWNVGIWDSYVLLCIGCKCVYVLCQIKTMLCYVIYKYCFFFQSCDKHWIDLTFAKIVHSIVSFKIEYLISRVCYIWQYEFTILVILSNKTFIYRRPFDSSHLMFYTIFLFYISKEWIPKPTTTRLNSADMIVKQAY